MLIEPKRLDSGCPPGKPKSAKYTYLGCGRYFKARLSARMNPFGRGNRALQPIGAYSSKVINMLSLLVMLGLDS